jgi:hypothetical protein
MELTTKDIETHIRHLDAVGLANEDQIEATDIFIDTFQPKPEYRYGKDSHGINRIVEGSR